MKLKDLVPKLGAIFTAVLAVAPLGAAADYPSQPITIIVPFPPGASADSVARVLAERMKSSLGQPIIVENVAGAGGRLHADTRQLDEPRRRPCGLPAPV
jgi:tripartite-type tricarboxylate transporter receptor subunit TctC